MPLIPADQRLLERAVELSEIALNLGNRPFGAVLGDAQGHILAEAQNDECTSADPTGHAEMNIVKRIAGLTQKQLEGATIYASGEPCAMCACAIFWSGVRRVVFAASGSFFSGLEKPNAMLMSLSCQEVLSHGSHEVEVIGPVSGTKAEDILRHAAESKRI